MKSGNISFDSQPSRKLATTDVNGNVLELPKQPQQHQHMIDVVDRFQGKWKEHVGVAKIAWGILTEDELLKTEGRLEKLAGLIQQRYAMSPPDANDEVEKFMLKCGY